MYDGETFEPSPLAYVYEEFARFLARRIEEGKIPEGARLPGERELAELYGVSIGTVRRALRILRQQGLVVTLRAKGTIVVPADQREQYRQNDK